MNIKSELLKKPMKWFPDISLSTFLLSIIIGIFIAIISIGVGQAIWMKMLFIAIGFIATLIWTYDNHRDDEEKQTTLKQGFGLILTTLLFIEIPLFFNAQLTDETQIKVLVMEKFKDGARTNPGSGEGVKAEYVQIPYRKVYFYKTETNEQIGTRNVEVGEDDKLALYTDIIGKQHYIEYFPFFTYSSEFKYIRDNNDSN